MKLTHKLLFLLKHFKECMQCQVESLLSITFQLLGFVFFSRHRRCCRSSVVEWTFPRRWCRMVKPSKAFYVRTHLYNPHFLKNKTQVLFSFRVQLSIPSAKSTANLQSVMDSGRLVHTSCTSSNNNQLMRYVPMIAMIDFAWKLHSSSSCDIPKLQSLVNCVLGTVQSLFISLSILRAIFIAENIL